MKRRALVTKIKHDEGKMIVFTEDSQFLKIPLSNNPPLLGDTIEVELPIEENKIYSIFSKDNVLKNNRWNKKWVSFAAVLMFIIVSIVYGQLGVASAAAFVNLDMKPSVQFTLDKNGKVQEVVGMNLEGKTLVDSISVNNKDIYTAVRETIRKANSLGFISEKDENIVMTSFVQLKKQKNPLFDEKQLRELIDHELASNEISGYLVMNKATEEEWEQAKSLNITMNEYLFMNHANEHGIEIQHDRFNNEHQVINYIKTNNIAVEKIFPNTSYHISSQNGQISDKEHSSSQKGTTEEAENKKIMENYSTNQDVNMENYSTNQDVNKEDSNSIKTEYDSADESFDSPHNGVTEEAENKNSFENHNQNQDVIDNPTKMEKEPSMVPTNNDFINGEEENQVENKSFHEENEYNYR